MSFSIMPWRVSREKEGWMVQEKECVSLMSSCCRRGSTLAPSHTVSPSPHSVWRQDELCRINETTSGPERKAALCALLEQEAQLIASIGRHKIAAGQENKEEAIRKFLDAVSTLICQPHIYDFSTHSTR